MLKQLKKIFLSKAGFIMIGVLALLCWATWIALYFNLQLWDLVPDGVLYFLLIFGIFIAYIKCETNIQKALFGALFLLLCNSNIEIWLNYYKNDIGGKPIYTSDIRTVLLILFGASFALTVASFISHLLLQSDHVGTKKAVFFNIFCGLLIGVMIAVGVYLALKNSISVMDITFLVSWALTYLYVLCIETRVQEYKKLRAAALKEGNWNPETRNSAKELFRF